MDKNELKEKTQQCGIPENVYFDDGKEILSVDEYTDETREEIIINYFLELSPIEQDILIGNVAKMIHDKKRFQTLKD